MKTKILVAGSQHFDQAHLVFGGLNALLHFYSKQTLCISSGPFSGIDQLASEWALQQGVEYQPMSIGESEKFSLSLFSSGLHMPDYVLLQDAEFEKIVKKLKETSPQLILLFPNPDTKQLGATSQMMTRAAQILHTPTIDASVIVQKVQKVQAQPTFCTATLQNTALKCR